MLVRNESDRGSAWSVQGPSRHFDRAQSTSALPLEQASAAPVGMSQTSDIRQRTVSLENLMDYGFQIFNLASTFANGNPNFVELLRVQSVGAIIPWRD